MPDPDPARRAARLVDAWNQTPTLIRRMLGVLLFAGLVGLAAFFVLWGLVLLAAIAAVGALVIAARSAYRWITGPDRDPLRRNVRIVRRSSDAP